MWSTLSKPWQLCLEQTWAAYCANTIPIGAVIVTADHDLVAEGRNRAYESNAPHGQVAGTTLAHAEINALLQLRTDDRQRSSYTLYTSVEPCPLCCGAAYMSGLREVYYAAKDGYAGSTNMFGKTPFLTNQDMKIHGPFPEIEEVVLTLNIDRFFRLNLKNTISWRINYWRDDCPQALSLAQETHAQGILQLAAEERWPTSRVVDYLATQVQNHRS